MQLCWVRYKLCRVSAQQIFTLLLLQQEGESSWDVLAHETQITHLKLALPSDDLSPVFQQIGSLTALRHLDAWGLTEPKPSDCRALEPLRRLTTLAIPYGYKNSSAVEQAALHTFTNLRQLKAHLPLTPNILAALQPLHALTQLHLEEGGTKAAPVSNSDVKRRDWASLRNLQLPVRSLLLLAGALDDEVLAAALAHMPCLQELDIESDSKLEGHGLKALPRCCPSLKALRSRLCMYLSDCYFPALQHLTDLVELTVEVSPSDRVEPCALAAHIPPNLTTLSLQYMVDGWQSYCEAPDDFQDDIYGGFTFGAFISSILCSLPSLRAPLRVLSLQRGHKTPFRDDDLECLAAAAPQLQHLEKLDLGDVEVTSGGLQQLLALPALAELTVDTFSDDLGYSAEDDDISAERGDTLMDALNELQAAFNLDGRSLTFSCG